MKIDSVYKEFVHTPQKHWFMVRKYLKTYFDTLLLISIFLNLRFSLINMAIQNLLHLYPNFEVKFVKRQMNMVAHHYGSDQFLDQA